MALSPRRNIVTPEPGDEADQARKLLEDCEADSALIVNGEVAWSAADGYTDARPGIIATAGA